MFVLFPSHDILGDEREEILRCGSNNVVNAFNTFYKNTFKASMKNIILKYKEQKEEQRSEGEAIQEIIKSATFTEIPEVLIDSEIHKMIHELEHSVNNQGLDLAGYLKSINKTHEDLHQDFDKQATERVKAALVLRQVAQENKIEASDEEIKAEVEKQKNRR